jgi:hypothetical protein
MEATRVGSISGIQALLPALKATLGASRSFVWRDPPRQSHPLPRPRLTRPEVTDRLDDLIELVLSGADDDGRWLLSLQIGFRPSASLCGSMTAPRDAQRASDASHRDRLPGADDIFGALDARGDGSDEER